MRHPAMLSIGLVLALGLMRDAGAIYVHNAPLMYTDPTGLVTMTCTRPLEALKAKFGQTIANKAYSWAPAMYHQYSCVVDRNGKVTCGGQDHAGPNWWWSEGKPSDDSLAGGMCEVAEPDNDEFEQCLKEEWAKPRPQYGIPIGTDCQQYDNTVIAICRARIRRASRK